jgi:LPS-assembly lipoprotein
MKRRTALALMGRTSLTGLAALSLGGCGFALRGPQSYGFQTLAILPSSGGALVAELRRNLGSNVQLLAANEPLGKAQVVLEILQEQREKVVVGVNSSGQVREFQLRIRLKFRVRTPQGDELVAPAEILQRRDFSFNETAVLAKEAEEALLYKDMQTDIVQQLLRRLATVRL